MNIKDLPPGDVFLHAGDFTMTGQVHEVEHFNKFLGETGYPLGAIVSVSIRAWCIFAPVALRGLTVNFVPHHSVLRHHIIIGNHGMFLKTQMAMPE